MYSEPVLILQPVLYCSAVGDLHGYCMINELINGRKVSCCDAQCHVIFDL
jgi:hypothetical protein